MRHSVANMPKSILCDGQFVNLFLSLISTEVVMSCMRNRQAFEPPSAINFELSIATLKNMSFGPYLLIDIFEITRAFFVIKPTLPIITDSFLSLIRLNLSILKLKFSNSDSVGRRLHFHRSKLDLNLMFSL